MDYKNRTVSILGIRYSISMNNETDEYLESKDIVGECDAANKTIKIKRFNVGPDAGNEFLYKLTLRHEIIHAYLSEAGLEECSQPSRCGWAVNEEMVDWFAHMWPNINKTFTELEL